MCIVEHLITNLFAYVCALLMAVPYRHFWAHLCIFEGTTFSNNRIVTTETVYCSKFLSIGPPMLREVKLHPFTIRLVYGI